MKFYRYMLAAIAALVLTAPVFAADDAATTNLASNDTTMQATDNAANATQQATDPSAATTAAKINLNQAGTKDLMKVKGINATKAKAIVAYRKKHGDFKSVDDLSKVKGFAKLKPDALTQITDQVSVN